MKLISFIGTDGDCIIIQQPTDIYPALDWCQSQMMEKQEIDPINAVKWEKAVFYLSRLMELVEKDGFGSQEDVDEIEY